MNLIVYNQYQYLWNYITVRTLKKQKLNQAFYAYLTSYFYFATSATSNQKQRQQEKQ